MTSPMTSPMPSQADAPAARAVTVRLFAAAAEAAGAEELQVPTAGATTVGQLVEELPVRTEEGSDELARVLSRCSFLVNGVRASSETTPIAAGDQLDVLPPFAGG